MKKIVTYYVSGHGYGHFTRSINVMRAILGSKVADVVVVRTKVSQNVFHETLTDNEKRQNLIVRNEPQHELDAGTVQTSPLDVDIWQTLENNATLFRDADELVKKEVKFLESFLDDQKHEKKLIAVLSDASPIGLAAAKQVGIPGLMISNFDWSSIMHGFMSTASKLMKSKSNSQTVKIKRGNEEIEIPIREFLQECRPSLQKLIDMNSTAIAMVRPMGAVPSPVPYIKLIDTPWICPPIASYDMNSHRKRLENCLFGENPQQNNCTENGINKMKQERKIILVTFGGQPGAIERRKLQTNQDDDVKMSLGRENEEKQFFANENMLLGFIFATRDAEEQVLIHREHGCGDGQKKNHLFAITSQKARKAVFGDITGGSIAELTRLSDVVLCKPGYGTVCEVVASGGTTTMVYVRREPEFCEEPYLIESLGEGAVLLSRDQFEKRQWYSAICKALSLEATEAMEKLTRSSDAMNGAETIANLVKSVTQIA